MNLKKIQFILFFLITVLFISYSNEVSNTGSKFKVSFSADNKNLSGIESLNKETLGIKNTGVALLVTGAICGGGAILSELALGFIQAILPVFSINSLIFPALIIPIGFFMLITGIMLASNAHKYLKYNIFYDKLDSLKKVGIALTAVFGSLTLVDIAGGLLYYFFYYNLLAEPLYMGLATAGLVIFTLGSVLPFFICALPILITGMIFSDLKKRVAAVSYADTKNQAFCTGFVFKF